MTTLIRYETAKAALAECRTVDEVKEIHDKAEAVRVYARMAEDVQLEIDAAEIRLRAERRMGLLLRDMNLHRGGRPKKTGSDEEPVSEPSVRLVDLGIDKKLSSRAQKVGGIADRAFDAIVDRMRQGMREGRVRVSLDLLKTDDKKERRANREKVLAAVQLSMPNRKFGVIYADPEWRFEVYSRDTGMDRAADNHYPTTVTDEICQRPVGDIAADDCVLFLWATVPMLPDALRVMSAWGFEYKSQVIWRKDRIGTGYWFRNAHELLLVGTRGKIPAPAMGTQFHSVIDAPVGAHSAKPDQFYELIEAYFPNLPKIELNARRARRGWTAWGLEAPADAAGNEIECDESGEIIEHDWAEPALGAAEPGITGVGSFYSLDHAQHHADHEQNQEDGRHECNDSHVPAHDATSNATHTNTNALQPCRVAAELELLRRTLIADQRTEVG